MVDGSVRFVNEFIDQAVCSAPSLEKPPVDVIHRDQTQAFTTKDGSTIRELLAYRNSCIRKQSLAEATVPPGVRTEAHYHERTEEIYYILSGCGNMFLDDESRQVRTGDAIAIPPGAVHWIENTGQSDLIFLCCCAPEYEHDDTILYKLPDA